MLVENKFLFISLPRCASTSFYISCLRSGFDIKHFENSMKVAAAEMSRNLFHIYRFLAGNILSYNYEDININKYVEKFYKIPDFIYDTITKYDITINTYTFKYDKYARLPCVWIASQC